MLIAVGVQHELNAALYSAHLFCIDLFSKNLTNFLVSCLNYRLHKIVHNLLLVDFVFTILCNNLNYLPKSPYIRRFSLFELLHSLLKHLFLFSFESFLFTLLFQLTLLLAMALIVCAALLAPLTAPTRYIIQLTI